MTMKNRIIPALLCGILLLSACATSVTDTSPSASPSASAGSTAETASPAPSPSTSPDAANALPSPLTEDDVRAMYEEPYIVHAVTPYEGDFLVQYSGLENLGPWFFDWVYGATGNRCKLMFCDEHIREIEIFYPGVLRVVTDGEYCGTPGWLFPNILTAYACVYLDENGNPLSYENSYTSERRTTYWADVAETNYFGTPDKTAAVAIAEVIPAGLTMTFGPPLDVEDNGSVFAGADFNPLIEFSYDEDRRVMTVTCRQTVLESGLLHPETDADWAADIKKWLDADDLPYPFGVDAGALGGMSAFIENAEITEVGDDVVVTLGLTDAAKYFTVTTTSSMFESSAPGFRLTFSDLEYNG